MGPFENVQALKETVQAELGNKKREESLQEYGSIFKTLHEVIECEVPQSLVDELSDAKMQDLKQGLAQKNKSFEEHLSSEGKTEEELKNGYA